MTIKKYNLLFITFFLCSCASNVAINDKLHVDPNKQLIIQHQDAIVTCTDAKSTLEVSGIVRNVHLCLYPYNKQIKIKHLKRLIPAGTAIKLNRFFCVNNFGNKSCSLIIELPTIYKNKEIIVPPVFVPVVGIGYSGHKEGLFKHASSSTSGGLTGYKFSTPKFLKGEIKNNIYTAKDKSFSVAIPHKQGTYEYAYMHVKEQYSVHGAYVSFGPAAFDHSIYRIQFIKRVTPHSRSVNFYDAAKRVVEKDSLLLQNAYGATPHKTESRHVTINGRKAFYCKLTQVVPAGKYISDKPVTLAQYIYIIDFKKAVVIAWSEIPETTEKIAMTPRAFAKSILVY